MLHVVTNPIAKTLMDKAQEAGRYAAGFEQKKIRLEQHEIVYVDNNNYGKPILLMVHGITGDKDNWTPISILLKKHYRIIALDLLGHGDSSREWDFNYKMSNQVAMVHNFVNAIGLNKFHMIGNSMGGYLSAMYAAKHPKQLASLILLDNAGLTEPNPSRMIDEMKETGRVPVIIRNTRGVDKALDYAFVKPPRMPLFLKRYYASVQRPHAELYDKIVSDFYVVNEGFHEPLEELLPDINIPVSVIWGEQDDMLDVSCVDVLKPALPKAWVTIMPKVGHVPMLESPQKTARYINKFVRSLDSRFSTPNADIGIIGRTRLV